MTAAVAPFTNGSWSIRAALVNDEPVFVAADACRALEHTNPTVALRMLDDDQILRLPRSEALNLIPDLDPRVQALTLVTEPGLYELAFRSLASGAKAFRRWVTGEVLPAIRRTGTYTGTAPQVPQTLPEALRLAADLAEERDRAQAELTAVAPKVEAYDAFLDADGLIAMGDAAKALGIGRNTMFRRLRELDILQSNNLPYQRYMHHFDVVLGTYTDREGRTHPTQTTRVRPSGVDYIRRRLASNLEVVSS